jgi:hypothetical protein
MIENLSNEGLLRDNEHLIQAINALIDGSRKLSNDLNRGPGGRENALVTTKLQEALHWALETKQII